MNKSIQYHEGDALLIIKPEGVIQVIGEEDEEGRPNDTHYLAMALAGIVKNPDLLHEAYDNVNDMIDGDLGTEPDVEFEPDFNVDSDYFEIEYPSEEDMN